ncbi:MAG: anti-sigma factor family protein [Nocardioides sp.]
MTCGYEELDAAYVLGALDPVEHADFERHLAGCPVCATAVAELAGLPPLLARVDADALLPAGPADEVPTTLLPVLVAAARRAERRRTALTALLGAAAAAVLAVVLVGSGTVGRSDPSAAPTVPTPSASVAVARPMTPVGYVPPRPQERVDLSADVALTGVAWGTRLDLTCTYDTVAGAPADYVLVVRTRDGRTQRVATWQALPGRTLRLSGATAARPDEIVSVEMRTAAGVPVLRLVV